MPTQKEMSMLQNKPNGTMLLRDVPKCQVDMIDDWVNSVNITTERDSEVHD